LTDAIDSYLQDYNQTKENIIQECEKAAHTICAIRIALGESVNNALEEQEELKKILQLVPLRKRQERISSMLNTLSIVSSSLITK
jgi:hypothetical protein